MKLSRHEAQFRLLSDGRRRIRQKFPGRLAVGARRIHTGDVAAAFFLQEIEHPAAYAMDSEETEGYAALPVEIFRRLDESNRSFLYDVHDTLARTPRQRRLEYKRLIRLDQALPRRPLAALLKGLPQGLFLLRRKEFDLFEFLQIFLKSHDDPPRA